MLSLKLPLNLPSELQKVPFVDISKELPINKNYTWEQLAGARKQEALTVIVVHHDAWPKSVSAKFNDLQLAQKIAQDHIDSKKNHVNGDAGFPYDLWVRNGVLYLCNDILAREYGVASNNAYTVNICVSGEYANYDALTDSDRSALYLGLLMLKDIMPSFQVIKGHNEINNTQCPGFKMNPVRKDIDSILLDMSMQGERSARVKRAAETANRIIALYKKSTDPADKYTDAALDKMDTIYGLLKEKNLLNG